MNFAEPQYYLYIYQIKGKVDPNWDTVTEEYDKNERPSEIKPIPKNSNDKENKTVLQNKSELQSEDPTANTTDVFVADNQNGDFAKDDDTSEEGWQEAFPKGRSPMSRKPSASKRPTLAKLNTNFLDTSSSSKYRAKPSPRTNLNENAASSVTASHAPKRPVRSPSFSPKPNAPSVQAASGKEKSANQRSAPTSPASSEVTRSSFVSSVSVQAAGKLFSYKEVAIAPPGTIVKAVAEQLPKESSAAEDHLNKETRDVTLASTPERSESDQKQKPSEEENPVESDKEIKSTTDKEINPTTEKSPEVVGVAECETATEIIEGDSKHESVSRLMESGSSENSNLVTSINEASEVQSAVTPLDSTPAANFAEKVTKGSSQLSNGSETADSPPNEEEKQYNDSGPHSPAEAEKQAESETGKEPSKKLSAAAPPYNPTTTIPVFGSIAAPVYNEHGGILPPPLNIAPIIAVNPVPVRRSPHQSSATARVPYGPRLAGGYNRSGNRLPSNKPAFNNGEHNGDQGLFIPPIIMNPHAAEFVPGPWVPNGYSVAPNGYMAPPNGMAFSPNGYPIAPNGCFPQSMNAVSPVGSTESPSAVNVEVTDEDGKVVAIEETAEGSSSNLTVNTSDASDKLQGEAVATEKVDSDQLEEDEKLLSEPEDKCTDTAPALAEITSEEKVCEAEDVEAVS